MNKVALANRAAAILNNPRKLMALYIVDALTWVAIGAVAMYCATKFGGL